MPPDQVTTCPDFGVNLTWALRTRVVHEVLGRSAHLREPSGAGAAQIKEPGVARPAGSCVWSQ